MKPSLKVMEGNPDALTLDEISSDAAMVDMMLEVIYENIKKYDLRFGIKAKKLAQEVLDLVPGKHL